jgi:NAD(P)-dependent dehydrogenase (short-subunit alcohol dehydrogenase family)
MGKLQDKVAVIIGGTAGTGIGAATARRMVKERAKVVLGDLNITGAEKLAQSIRDSGGIIQTQFVDLEQENSVKSIMEATKKQFGGINCVFLNGADNSQEANRSDTDVVTIDLSFWDHIMAVNLRGYLLGARFSIPIMLEAGGGSIVCTSSESALTAYDGIRVAYGVSKAGVNQLVRHIARRFGREGIRCNCISPGFIETENALSLITPHKKELYAKAICVRRFGQPEDIAAEAVHLLSDDAAYINGQTFIVNGGSLLI